MLLPSCPSKQRTAKGQTGLNETGSLFIRQIEAFWNQSRHFPAEASRRTHQLFRSLPVGLNVHESTQSSGHSKNYYPHPYVGIGGVAVPPMASAEIKRGLPGRELELLEHISGVEELPEFCLLLALRKLDITSSIKNGLLSAKAAISPKKRSKVRLLPVLSNMNPKRSYPICCSFICQNKADAMCDGACFYWGSTQRSVSFVLASMDNKLPNNRRKYTCQNRRRIIYAAEPNPRAVYSSSCCCKPSPLQSSSTAATRSILCV